VIRRRKVPETDLGHVEGGERGERCEALRTEARALAGVLCESDEAQVELGRDRVVALSFHVLEDGDRDDVVAIAFALTDLAGSLRADSPNRKLAVVRLGAIVWALVAYALSRNRIDALSDLMVARIPGAEPNEPAKPLLTELGFRYAEAFDRDPARTFDSYRNWLMRSNELRTRFPAFFEHANGWLAEADLLLALRAHAAHDWGNYSHGASLDDFAAVRALRRRLRLSAQRPELARFFGVRELLLNEMMERLYGGLKIEEAELARRPLSLVERA